MPPAKARTSQDDPKSEAANPKDKAGHGSAAHQTNGKSRRVASAAGSQLREVTNASAAVAAPPTVHEATNPGLQWTSFDRSVLHAYRRVYRLNTPAAFANDYHRWVLSQPGSIGLQSPTMARRKESRRQSKEQLANSARKHFNGLGTQENDVIVDFLHKVRSQGVTKPERPRRTEHAGPESSKQ